MNFLQLVNRTRQECGASGGSTPLGSAQNQLGESKRFADWVNAAWLDIQTSKDNWDWMREEFQFTLTPQKQTYTATEAGVGSSFGNWKVDSFRLASQVDLVDEQLLNFLEYATFRNLYQYGSMRTTYSRPVVMTVTPGKDLAFGAVPDLAYIAVGEYYRAPASMTSDTTPPDLPERFHMAVVYRAMMYYGGYESAPEVYQRGEMEFKRLMNRLEIDQLPTLVSGAPLA